MSSAVYRNPVFSKALNNRFNTLRVRHFENTSKSRSFVSFQKTQGVQKPAGKYDFNFIAG
ncbi:MAG: hypothetical protein ACLFNB_02895 [Candidatus Woesearchaeota archaeon]